MAQVTEIRLVKRPIRITKKTTIDIAQDENWFSIWIHEAGQEKGLTPCPVSLQINRKTAEELMNLLGKFLNKK